MRGLAAVCKYLLNTAGFTYVLLREIQSDRIEGEFGVYRQSTGVNAFMTAGDVSAASKKRLARHAAKFLKSLEFEEEQHNHVCIVSVVIDDASAMEESVSSITLSSSEKSSCAYVTGWLEGKCDELVFTDDNPLVTSDVKNFIEEVSRGCLKIPHECTYQLVELGLCFVKKARHRACCCRRLSSVLSTMGYFYNLRNIVTCR